MLLYDIRGTFVGWVQGAPLRVRNIHGMHTTLMGWVSLRGKGVRGWGEELRRKAGNRGRGRRWRERKDRGRDRGRERDKARQRGKGAQEPAGLFRGAAGVKKRENWWSAALKGAFRTGTQSLTQPHSTWHSEVWPRVLGWLSICLNTDKRTEGCKTLGLARYLPECWQMRLARWPGVDQHNAWMLTPSICVFQREPRIDILNSEPCLRQSSSGKVSPGTWKETSSTLYSLFVKSMRILCSFLVMFVLGLREDIVLNCFPCVWSKHECEIFNFTSPPTP